MIRDRSNQNVVAVACLLENLHPYDIVGLDCALFRSGCDDLEFDLLILIRLQVEAI